MARSVSTPEQRAEVLKERIYDTFTSLAVVMASSSHADELIPGAAAVTLPITVGGTLLAVLVADLVAHIAVHAAVPNRAELAHDLGVDPGTGVIALPMIFVGLAGVGVWEVAAALRASTIALIVSLVGIGYLAVRRIRLPRASD